MPSACPEHPNQPAQIYGTGSDKTTNTSSAKKPMGDGEKGSVDYTETGRCYWRCL